MFVFIYVNNPCDFSFLMYTYIYQFDMNAPIHYIYIIYPSRVYTVYGVAEPLTCFQRSATLLRGQKFC